MAVIDDKVVAMSFESSKFESGVSSTISALDKLKASLKLPASSKGLEDVGRAAQKIDLSRIGQSLDAITQKLGYFSVAALAIFANVAAKAVQAGAQMIKGLTLQPILAGYQEYSTNLNSIQTILANTEASGATLDDVNKALNQLNVYSDKTIYNFSQMARNIGTFTAAGVDLQTSTNAIKGIANLAALSGSNADQASTAMYQLSQAIAAGSVKLQDWNSVVNAGMGGTVFQRALAQTAEAMGTLEKGTVKLTGPMKNVTIAGQAFRQSLSTPGKASWLTSKVLTQTLKQFTGDLKNADLAAMGFNKSQIKAIQQTAKTAMFAATEVKTLTQVLDVAKETAGSGWAKTWQLIFGDFGEAKRTFTDLSNAVNGFINANAKARNSVLTAWKDMGGRTLLIDAIKTAFTNLGLILKPIRKAFRDIFPAKTGQDLFNFTNKISDFAYALAPTAKTMNNLRRTFRGLFAVLDIGKQIVSGIFGVFGKLFDTLNTGSGSFLKFTAKIGDFLVNLDESLKKGDKLSKFFDGLGTVLAAPIKLLQQLAKLIGEVFDTGATKGFTTEVKGMSSVMDVFSAILDKVAEAFGKFINQVRGAPQILKPFIQAYTNLISGIGDAIGTAASNMNFDAIFQVIRTGLFASLVLMFRKFFGKGSFMEQISRMGRGLSGGILGNISGAFQGLNGSMQAMQQNIKAKTLKEIAIAIALLVASVVALSFVSPEKVNAGVGSIAVLMGELLGAMAIMTKISKSGGIISLPIMAASLILLAGAIDILVLAVLGLSRLSWSELTKGLVGVGALLLGISKAVGPLSANSAGMIRASVGITAIAASIVVLSLAVKIMGSMNLDDLAKGLGGVAVGLGAMVAAMNLMPVVPLRTSLGIIAIAGALVIMAGAIKLMGSMNLRELGRGLGGMAGSLAAMVAAMNLMPAEGTLRSAAALLVLATAMGVMAGALKLMGTMSPQELATSLTSLGVSLLLLTVAMNKMAGSVRGAVTLGLIAAGMAVLAPALVLMGKQSWTELVKGLITLGGALVIIGTAGKLLGPAVPAMLGFGVALLAIGAGLALAGAGILAIGLGLSAIAVAGPAAVGIMVAAMRDLLEGVIENSKLLVLGLLEIVKAFADTAPKFTAAIVKIINNLLDVVIQAAPKIAQVFIAIIDAALKVINERKDAIIAAGFALLISLLEGIKQNIGQVTQQVIDIVVVFLKTLASNLSRIVASGVQVLVKFLEGIAKGLPKVITAAVDIVVKFLEGIAKNISRIVASGANVVVKWIEGVAKNLPKIVDAGIKFIIAFINALSKAIDNNSEKMGAAGARLGIAIIKGMIKGIWGMAGELLSQLTKLAENALEALKSPFSRISGLGRNIIQGLIDGLQNAARGLYNKAKEIADNVKGFFKNIWKVFSPSKVFMAYGGFLMEGLTIGLDANAKDVYASAISIANGVITAFKTIFQTNSPSKVMMEIGQFVGQGFAQGLKGSQDDIRSVFKELNGMLTDAMSDARETIIEEEAKLDELRKAKKPDSKAIEEAQRIIAQNESILKRSAAARQTLIKGLSDEKIKLLGLTKEYEKLGLQLQAAQDKLTELKQEKADFIASTTDQFGALPDIPTTDADGNPIDQLTAYMDALANQTEAVATYKQTLEQLRKLGLDDATYEKLLAEGTADQAFATQLLAGGKTAVEGLNTLDKQLQTTSKSLAVQAAKNLKQAGIDAAQGLVDGLKSKRTAIYNVMREIAREMIKALRKELESNSPSKKFMEIGEDSMLGLAYGFSRSTKMVTKAIVGAADDALSSMKSSLSKISDVVMDQMDVNPTITPILDLSYIRGQASELADLTNVSPITAAASYNQATAISAEEIAAMAESVNAANAPTVTFEQNNYSPKALSEIEIYRQTKNQISQVKSALAIT